MYLNISNFVSLQDVSFVQNTGFQQGGVIVGLVLNTIIANKVYAEENKCGNEDGMKGPLSGSNNLLQGGGVFTLTNLNSLTLKLGVFIRNKAVGGGGGVISASTQNWLSVQDTVFNFNEASGGDGGAVNVGQQATRVMFFNCTFLNNRALTSGCGGLAIGPFSTALIASTRFEGNWVVTVGHTRIYLKFEIKRPNLLSKKLFECTEDIARTFTANIIEAEQIDSLHEPPSNFICDPTVDARTLVIQYYG